MQFRFTLMAIVIAIALFLAMLGFLEIGRRIGVRRLNVPGARTGVGVVDGTVYALLALLIGFAFNGAAARFDSRRGLLGETTNAAGTAWQRIEVLPAEQQPPVREAMRVYIDALVAAYTQPAGTTDPLLHSTAVIRAQDDLWVKAVAACVTQTGERARMLLLPALNEMFGAVEKERLARAIHPPWVIFGMLGLAALAGALFVGYALANADRRNWLYMVGVAATIASATYVIVELEYPRLGLVRIDSADRMLVQLRDTMK
jgi:hypothetical protein